MRILCTSLFIFIFILPFRPPLFAQTIVPDKDASGKIVVTAGAFTSQAYSFRGTGVSCAVLASATTNCEYALTFTTSVNFNGVHIIGASAGDAVNLKVIDTPTGTYSKIPNGVLRQYGYNWYLKAVSHKEIIPYSSLLHMGMRLVVEYINTGAAKTVYINYYLHK